MITMLYGYPGGGKSYYAVSNYIIPHMKGGKHVYSSMAGFDALRAGVIHGVDPNLYHSIDPNNFTPWLDLPEGSTQSLFVLDEVQNLYGSSNFKDHAKERELLKQYLSTHRHSGDAVLAICQEPSTVDKFFRDLTEHYVELRKLNMIFGQNTKTFSAIHRKGGTGKSNKVIRQETLNYRPEFFICYQSTLPGAAETKTKSDSVRVNPLKVLGPVLIALLFLFGGVGVFFYQRRDKSKSENIVEPSSSSKPLIKNGGSNVSKISISANGWIADSMCVNWLTDAVQVARSCPDFGYRSGSLPCVSAFGDSCLVEVLAHQMAGSGDRLQGAEMEFQGSRQPWRDSSAPGW